MTKSPDSWRFLRGHLVWGRERERERERERDTLEQPHFKLGTFNKVISKLVVPKKSRFQCEISKVEASFKYWLFFFHPDCLEWLRLPVLPLLSDGHMIRSVVAGDLGTGGISLSCCSSSYFAYSIFCFFFIFFVFFSCFFFFLL